MFFILCQEFSGAAIQSGFVEVLILNFHERLTEQDLHDRGCR